MERLSNNAMELLNELHTERLEYNSEYLPLIEAAHRLAAYEDTGLTPEEIHELTHSSYGPLHKKLGEWIDADRDGRMIIRPCAIGDPVWGIRNHKGHRCAHHGFVSEMYYSQDMKLIIVVKNICRGEFGKTVFLTREDADAAMRGEIDDKS